MALLGCGSDVLDLLMEESLPPAERHLMGVRAGGAPRGDAPTVRALSYYLMLSHTIACYLMLSDNAISLDQFIKWPVGDALGDPRREGGVRRGPAAAWRPRHRGRVRCFFESAFVASPFVASPISPTCFSIARRDGAGRLRLVPATIALRCCSGSWPGGRDQWPLVVAEQEVRKDTLRAALLAAEVEVAPYRTVAVSVCPSLFVHLCECLSVSACL
eukprot:SAG31_NODE_4198_length_3481_cov_21.063868_2_plen_216_part_00